jgi:hypothetical protein
MWQAAGALWRRAPGAVAAGARGLQSGSDDRVVGPMIFDRIVRQYDYEGNLSRHMNPEIEKVSNLISAPPLASTAPAQHWLAWAIRVSIDPTS